MTAGPTEFEKRFDAAMFQDVYQRALKECRYRASLFLHMLAVDGGLATALKLIRSARPSDGFTTLWKKGRLDLTVEALVLRYPWRTLFSDEDLSRAEERLASYGYKSV